MIRQCLSKKITSSNEGHREKTNEHDKTYNMYKVKKFKKKLYFQLDIAH